MALDYIAPMKAAGAKESELPGGDEWWFEIKWDGMRAILLIDPTEQPPCRIYTSNGIDATNRFPELAGCAEVFHATSAVADGEIVAFDESGAPSFERLQSRMHVASRRDAERRAQTTPVTLVLFDLLCLDGHDITSLPLRDRRRALETVFGPGEHWQFSPISDDGPTLLAAAGERRLEGIVAKRRDSAYAPGQRSPHWRKIKLRRHDEFVVGGWHEGERGRRGTIGGLLIGYYDDRGQLQYTGNVGSGLTDSEIKTLEALFARTAIDSSPFVAGAVPRVEARRARWVEPALVVEVAYSDFTAEGRARHPSYLSRRVDKDPRAVFRPL